MYKYQQQIDTYLQAHSDKNYDYSFHSDTIGTRIPIVQKVAKGIVKAGEAENYLNNYEKNYFEDDVIYGMLCGLIKVDDHIRIKYLNQFLTLVDGWATCDLSVARWKFIKKNKSFYINWVRELINSNYSWNQRVAYVVLLSYYLDDEYVNQTIELLKKPMQDAYYTEMAAAWLISMGLVKQKEKFIELLNTFEFSSFVYQKGLQKAIESYRSSKEDKELYRQMKKSGNSPT